MYMTARPGYSDRNRCNHVGRIWETKTIIRGPGLQVKRFSWPLLASCAHYLLFIYCFFA